MTIDMDGASGRSTETALTIISVFADLLAIAAFLGLPMGDIAIRVAIVGGLAVVSLVLSLTVLVKTGTFFLTPKAAFVPPKVVLRRLIGSGLAFALSLVLIAGCWLAWSAEQAKNEPTSVPTSDTSAPPTPTPSR